MIILLNAQESEQVHHTEKDGFVIKEKALQNLMGMKQTLASSRFHNSSMQTAFD
jgi:hypothetical protein